jgi:hypothetical protein
VKLVINFNESQLIDFRNGNKPLIYEIYWVEDSVYYPMNHWSDFGNAVLGSWVNSIIELLSGNTESEFCFLDGSYSIKLKMNPSDRVVELYPQKRNFVWKISMKELIIELINAFKMVSGELAKRGIGEEEKLYCTTCAKTLKNYLERL